MLEKEIEKKVCDYARKQGFMVYKFSSPNHVGVPDRMFVGPYQHVFWIEFKAEGKQPTPVQAREAAKLVKCGFDVFLVDDVQFGMQVIDKQQRIAAAKCQAYVMGTLEMEKDREEEQAHATKH